MKVLLELIQCEDKINDLLKASIVHFYLQFLHPYFSGNGRMARLVHLWFLIQKGYQSALFILFSSQIEKAARHIMMLLRLWKITGSTVAESM
ncbi:MAG: Fic family protein [Acutalibacter sp.]|nr:Fic family protein [Acutalibacter sp.]